MAGATATAVAMRLPAARAMAAAAAQQPSPLTEFEYGAVRLMGGPLQQQYNRVHATYLALDNDRLLKVYRERAGLPAPGAAMGGWYDADGFVPGHTLGQYISGSPALWQDLQQRWAKKIGSSPDRTRKSCGRVTSWISTWRG
jgi:hypothetical protein